VNLIISEREVSERLDSLISGISLSDKDAALSELYYETKTAIYAFALSILKNSHDAEDVLHDCYLNIYSAAASYRSQGKPMAWILRIARNLCYIKLRERKKLSDTSESDVEPFIASDNSLPLEDLVLIRECMRSLSDDERQIVVLHAVAGYKHREIAELLEMALPTVLSKYHRALKKLKQHV